MYLDRLYNPVDGLPAGLYIVRQGNISKKLP